MKQKAFGLFLAIVAGVIFSSNQVLAVACSTGGQSGTCSTVKNCSSGNYGGDLACGAEVCCIPDGISSGSGTSTGPATLDTAATIEAARQAAEAEATARATSPAPVATGGTATAPATAGGGGGTSTRTAVTGTTYTAKGLYIPSGSEVGLSDQTITALIVNLLNWLLYIFGFVAIIAFVIAGIQYLLAAGSEEMAKKAKENMQYAMIGVLVALSALIIIRAIQAVLGGFRDF